MTVCYLFQSKETAFVEIPERKSERIALVIAKANQIAAIEWLHAIIEEHAAPVRQDMAELQGSLGKGTTPTTVLIEEFKLPELAAPNGRAKSTGMSAYWAKMTPEERSAEMQRRADMRKGVTPAVKLRPGLHPRDPEHPGHEKWLAGVRKRSRKFWASLSPAQRKERLRKMQAGRRTS